MANLTDSTLVTKLITVLDTFEKRFSLLENYNNVIMKNTVQLRSDFSVLLLKLDDAKNMCINTDSVDLETKVKKLVSINEQNMADSQLLHGLHLSISPEGLVNGQNGFFHADKLNGIHASNDLGESVPCGISGDKYNPDASIPILCEGQGQLDYSKTEHERAKYSHADLTLQSSNNMNHATPIPSSATGSEWRGHETASVACSSQESRESSFEIDRIYSPRRLSLRHRRHRLNSLLEQQRSRISWSKYIKQNISTIKGWERLWYDMVKSLFGIQPRNTPMGIDGSKIIDPFSPFHAGVEFFIACLLIYSFFVVPIQLSVWVTDDVCKLPPTQYFDMTTEIAFMSEIAYRFVVGFVDKYGNYCDDLNTVALLQFSSPSLFWFNLVTSAPVAWIEWTTVQGICGGEDPSPDSSSGVSNIGLIRVIKTIRLFKLLRFLKLSSFYRMLNERLDVYPVALRLSKIVTVLLLAMHIFACGFWRLKYEIDQDSLQTFLLSREISGKDAQENYMICLYFVCTVFTTVGFGDIYALNHSERIFCVAMMIVAACLFGTILGEVQSLFASVYKKNQEIDDQLEATTNFLTVNKVPVLLQRKVKTWLRMRLLQGRATENMKNIMDLLPRDMFGQIAVIMNGLMFSKVPTFRLIHDKEDQARLAAALVPYTRTANFPNQAVIAHHADAADRVIIIASGRVAMCMKTEDGSPETINDRLCVLQEGDGFGDASILGDTRWGGTFGVDASFIAMETVNVSYIYTKDILEILKDPALYAVKRLFMRIRKSKMKAQGNESVPVKMKDTYLWVMLAQKLLKKHDTLLKRSVSDLFPDRALAAVKKVQSQEQNAKDTWVKSTHVEIEDEVQGHGEILPCAELGFLKDEHFTEANYLKKETF